MKIAVLSDSHYETSFINDIKEYLEDIDIILHCGDGAPDTKALSNIFRGEIYAVKGNCDMSKEYPLERIIEVMGIKIFMTHGHMYNVKNEYNTIFYKGKEVDADIVLFGHSHKALIKDYDGLVIMNPGSISLPYGRAKRTFGIIEILKNNKRNISIKEIE